MSQFALEAGGKEQGGYLSHASGIVRLRPTIQGEGEMFQIENVSDLSSNIVYLACLGQEKGQYLSHSADKVSLRDGKPSKEEEWYWQRLTDPATDGYVTFRCHGESDKYLSHAFGELSLQHDTGEGELWSLQKPIKTLTDIEFTRQTANWSLLEGEVSADKFDFFKVPKLMLGAELFSNAVELMLSRTSVSTLKVRFGLEKQGVSNETAEVPDKFNVILFGTDDCGEVLTPYYVAESQTEQTPVELYPNQGNVPTTLFHIWRNYWLVKDRTPIDCKLFTSHYGFLKGYNYSIKEFYSLFTKATTGVVPNILIRFVLHKFKPIKEDININDGYTFGIVFQSDYNFSPDQLNQNELGGAKVGDGDDGSLFYDLSMPCPRTC